MKSGEDHFYPADEDWTKMQPAVKKTLKGLAEQASNLATNEK
jgi:hypothetical protein